MSHRQRPLDMRNLTNQLVEVVRWYELGVALGIPAHKLDSTDQNYRGDSNRCKMGMLDIWLRTDLNASWEKLADALVAQGYDKVADKVRVECLGLPSATPTATAGIRVVQDYSLPSDNLPPAPTMGGQSRDELMGFALSLIRSQQEDKSEQLVRSLTNWDYDIDHADEMNQTLLHFAAQSGDTDTVKVLITFGANVNCKNTFGQTPVDLAMMQGHRSIVGLLRSVGSQSSLKPQQETGSLSSLAGGASLIKRINGYRVLSLDSSGATAIMQLEILSRFEKQTGRRITQLFDWIVASGIGAVFIIGMIYADKTLAELRKLFFRLREKVFAEKRTGFRSEALELVLKELLGTDMRMCDKPHPRLLVGAVNKKTTNLKLNFFNNCLQDEFSQTPVWKVARYTSASPIFMVEFEDYVDGGTLCSNLCDHALTRIRDFCKQKEEGQIGCVVSVGTGVFAPKELGFMDARQYLTADSHWDNPVNGQKMVVNIVTLQLSANATLAEEMSKKLQKSMRSPRHSLLSLQPGNRGSLPSPWRARPEANHQHCRPNHRPDPR